MSEIESAESFFDTLVSVIGTDIEPTVTMAGQVIDAIRERDAAVTRAALERAAQECERLGRTEMDGKPPVLAWAAAAYVAAQNIRDMAKEEPHA